MSLEEKRELVYDLSEWSEGAQEVLQSWSRQDILQILCIETGKERKYTGLTKLKIIEVLLKVVADKKSQRVNKKQRKSNQSSHSNMHTDDSSIVSIVDCDLDSSESKLCENSACRAKVSQVDAFCKRCSCCICRQFDDNKDPSLWLTCSSEPPYQGNSCGLSCHLECALKHEKSCFSKVRHSKELDGIFYCVSCGKVNDLLQCWRKQMMTAKDTRRVDILCYRVSLSQKLLAGTVRYGNLQKIVNEIIKKLEADVGPLTGLPVKRARGIINRLPSGQEVQRLCTFAVESLDSVLSNTHDPVVKYDVRPKGSQSQSLATNSSSLSNPSSVEDENNNLVGYKDTKEKQTNNSNEQETIAPDDINIVKTGKEFDPFDNMTEGELPITPCKAESSKDGNLARESRPKPSKNNLDDGSGKEQDGSSSKKRSSEEGQDGDFGYYVKVIRRLECEQFIDKSFRQKFLTWYSLRASPQEVRIVKVFVDTMIDDPHLLAGQLMDTFSEVMTSKKCPKGLCMKLFH